MTPTEWRKKEIKLKQRATKARNDAKHPNQRLLDKIKRIAYADLCDEDLRQHRLNHYSIVNQ